MIEANEVLDGLWHFSDSDAARNFFVALQGSHALVVDPGLHDAVDHFAGDVAAQVALVVLTEEGHDAAAPEEWPGIPLLRPGALGDNTPLPAPFAEWRALLPGAPHRAVVLNAKQRVLLSGAYLRSPGAGVPHLLNGADQYLAALDALQKLDLRLVLPARGEAASGKRAITQRFEYERSYVNSVLRHVTTSVVAGVPLERMIAVARELYGDYAFLDAHIENMQLAWQEIRGRA